jgi:4-hydroxybenzoate polyprenyltransferase
MKLDVLLRLGRVSNVPTVLSNVMAGMVLAGADPRPLDIAWIGSAAAALYVGGMFLNDAFDAEIDAAQRPERPIPAREIARRTVFAIGFGLLLVGVALVLGHAVHTGAGAASVLAAAATSVLIVVYDAWHKGNSAAPVIMGLCRVGVYLTAGLAVASGANAPLLGGCALLLAYVVGLTYVAGFESGSSPIRRFWPLAGLFAPILFVAPSLGRSLVLPIACAAFALWVLRAVNLARRGGGSIKKAVGSLIAGIALVDAMLIASKGSIALSFVAMAMFGVTLALHRRVAGT